MKHFDIEPVNIDKMEARLDEVGSSKDELLARAVVTVSTWNRWKRGTFAPNYSKWRAVRRAYLDILSEAASGAKADSDGHIKHA